MIRRQIKEGAALAALSVFVLGLISWAEIARQLWS